MVSPLWIGQMGQAPKWVRFGEQMTDTKKTMAQIAALAGLGIEGDAGDFIAEAVALLAQRLPTKGAGGVAPEPQTEPARQGPALRRLLVLTGWDVGTSGSMEWVGPSCANRWATIFRNEGRVTLWVGGGSRYIGGWNLRKVTGDPMEAACAEILRRHDEGIDPLPLLRAPESDHDPRIGKWCLDSDGDEGLVVSTRPANDGDCIYAIRKGGQPAALFKDATITTPPDPIPEPCRPAWEAFRALESRDG